MDVLKTRCPSCSKLYAVERQDVTTKRPEFECSSCEVRFAFDMPDFIESVDEVEVSSFLVDWKAMPELIEETPRDQIDCPKCKFSNPVDAVECFSCGVILEKAKSEDEYRSTARVRDHWERVLMNYEDESRHSDFVHFCRQDGCLPFAAKKYQAILEADPSEDIALRMRARVQGIAESDMIGSSYDAEMVPFVSKSFVLGSIGAVLLAVITIHGLFGVDWTRAIGAVLCLLGLSYLFRKSWMPYIDL